MPTYFTALWEPIPYSLYSYMAFTPLQELTAIFSSPVQELMPYSFCSSIPRFTDTISYVFHSPTEQIPYKFRSCI
jgi:hypothetical protein